MTRQEQREFIVMLAYGIVDKILDRIDAGDVPENWDGHQLRPYLADSTARNCELGAMTRSQRKSYENDVLVNNL